MDEIKKAVLNAIFDKLAEKSIEKGWRIFCNQRYVIEAKKKWEKILSKRDEGENNLRLIEARAMLEDWAKDLDAFILGIRHEIREFEIAEENKSVCRKRKACASSSGTETVAKFQEFSTRLKDILMPLNREASTSQPSQRLLQDRNEDQEILIEHLEGLTDNQSKIGVIPIVGIRGIGKTALVQHVYENATPSFDLKAWFEVSGDCDVLTIGSALLEDITEESCRISNKHTVLRKLGDILQGKKFLIVLDDLRMNCEAGWRENWTAIESSLMRADLSSKIIVTTREESVADAVRTIINYQVLQRMPQEDCWHLFCRHANVFDADFDLAKREIAKDIVRRCEGVPAIATHFGWKLRNKHDIQIWRDVSTYCQNSTSAIWEQV